MKYISDIVFCTGLATMAVGITFAYSWPVACIIAGSVLMIVGAAVGIIRARASATPKGD